MCNVMCLTKSLFTCAECSTLGVDKTHRQIPLPAEAIRTLVQTLDPTSFADFVFKAVLLVGFTCFLRPNSFQELRWMDLTFEATLDEAGDLHVEVLVSVPDLNVVENNAALGGASR